MPPRAAVRDAQSAAPVGFLNLHNEEERLLFFLL